MFSCELVLGSNRQEGTGVDNVHFSIQQRQYIRTSVCRVLDRNCNASPEKSSLDTNKCKIYRWIGG
jgi:hypothetical protein